MLSLDELLHPITPDQFRADYEGRKPLHIPAGDGDRKREILSWAAFNDLLNQQALWTPSRLRLMRDHMAVPPEQFCRPTRTPDGSVMRPIPGRVELFLSAGSSLVANDVLHFHPPLTAVGRTLSEAFGGDVGANVYCSFRGVQAFGTHFDDHEVIVVHTEGEKVWNLYEARADNPLVTFPDTPETRLWFERTRGPVMQKVTMRPGDVLYLPCGWYHDALAGDGGSLHVSFSITPLYGRSLLNLLDGPGMLDPVFRAWLPPAGRDGGEPLRRRLAEMGRLLASLAESPSLFDEVAMAQERLVPRPSTFELPQRKPLTLYQTTGHAFPATTAVVRTAYDWAIQERQFALEDMVAQFDMISEADVRAAVTAAEQAGAIRRA